MLNLRSSKSLKLLSVLSLLIFPLSAGPKGDPRSWDEVLLELADLRHELKSAQVDFDILREKLQKTNPTPQGTDASKLVALEKKLTALESLTDKLTTDVRTLNSCLSQVSKSVTTLQGEVTAQTKLLEDLGSLKGTLTSISKAMTPPPSPNIYKVKAGDSLSLIAKTTKVSIEEIKKLNPSIKDDKIRVGQELKLSHAAP